MLKKLLFIFFCLSLYPLFAQVNNDISQESTFSVISTDFNQNEEMNIYKQLLSEIQMQKQDLEKENEQIQKALTISNQAFDRVTNAYWALFGIIISIALFVLGGNFIFQTINQKKISKSILDDVLSKSMEEIDKINKKNEQEMQNTFEILDKNNNHKTNEAIKEIKKLQLKMLSQELEKNISEKQIASSMNTTLEIIGLYFDLYGEDQGFNQYDGDIINHFNYLKKCLNEGNKFWSWNINSVNSLKKSCPQRLSGEFDKVLKIAEFDSKHI